MGGRRGRGGGGKGQGAEGSKGQGRGGKGQLEGDEVLGWRSADEGQVTGGAGEGAEGEGGQGGGGAAADAELAAPAPGEGGVGCKGKGSLTESSAKSTVTGSKVEGPNRKEASQERLKEKVEKRKGRRGDRRGGGGGRRRRTEGEGARRALALPDVAQADLADPRFQSLFSSHHYAIDPTDPRFQK